MTDQTPVRSTTPALDSRFLQANERTFLAWIRTSLAMMTFGFVVARLGTWLNDIREVRSEPQVPFATALGVAFVVAAVLVDLLALVRYRRACADLLAGRAPSPDQLPMVFGTLVTVLGVGVVVYMVKVLAP